MKIVVVGNGGREAALAKKLARDGHEVLVTPGRAGIPGSVGTPPEELEAELFVIGPEDPLVNGLADRLRAQGNLVYGPGANDAQLEGSKIWMKQLLTRAGVLTADYRVFVPGEELAAEQFIRDSEWAGWTKWVIKTDYLAAGKGVLVTDVSGAAIADARDKLKHGAIVIEEALVGREVSFFAVCSGTSWSLLPLARDNKRLLDGDRGPNTGGMGSFSPLGGGFSSHDDVSLAELTAIIDPVLGELEDFRGTLFGGLMITEHGAYVLEFNIRFGDPEIQSIVLGLKPDLGQLLYHAANGWPLTNNWIESSGACVTVVLASEGYPTNPVKGDVITGIEAAEQVEGVTVFHAGTAVDQDGNYVTAGGRVLSVTAQAGSVAAARKLAYKAVKLISWRGVQYRTDIAAGVR